MLLDGCADFLDIGTNNGLDLFAVLEEQNGRHVCDSIFSADIRNLVNVNLEEMSVLELGLELVQKGSNHLAGTAPGGKKVHDSETRELGLFLELRQRSDFLNHGDFRG